MKKIESYLFFFGVFYFAFYGAIVSIIELLSIEFNSTVSYVAKGLTIVWSIFLLIGADVKVTHTKDDK
jgi:hypothetical protein